MEVRKLYPDAELPRLFVETREAERLVLRYESPRSLEDLAEGLLRGCAHHFADPMRIEREVVHRANGTGSAQVVRFTLTRARGAD